jgi:predicted permease
MALRTFAKRPVFLLIATLSLAIGIGANTAIFSVVNAVFMQQYPYRAADQLVRVYTNVEGRTEYGTTSFPNYRDMRGFDPAFQALGAYKTIFTRMELQDETVRVMGEGVSQTLFPMLGINAVVGRTFLPEEDEVPGASPVMMLGYGLWQRAFAGDPSIVGTTVRLAGQSFAIVGVVPEGFHGLTAAGIRADFYVPLTMYGTASGLTNHAHFQDRFDRRYVVVGRILDGMRVETAQAQLEVLGRQIQDANPDLDQEWAFSLIPMRDVAMDPDVDRAIRPFAVLLLTAGGLVLVLACTNLASLLLARVSDRRKEIALRLALGSSRGRLVRQLLTETVLLALLGGTAGLLLAGWTLSLVTRFQPPLPVPITLDLGLDRTVLLFTFFISMVTGLLFGLAPALQSTSPDVVPALKDDLGPVRLRRFGLRNVLVAFQMALSVVLLVGGGLFVRSLGAAQDADLGFTTRNAGIAWVDLSLSDVPREQYRSLRDELAERARALPGVDAATVASHIPFFGSASGGFYNIPGVEPPTEGAGHNVQREEVDPDFFETLGIPLVTGRTFTEQDRPGAPLVAIVNETAASWFWPGESPLGKEFLPLQSGQRFRVIGVVGDTKIERLREPPKPLFYFPIAQRTDPDLILVARGLPTGSDIAAMLRQMIRDVHPGLMIVETLTMEDNIGVILFPARMAALLLGVFGLLALTLATIGLYGVVSFSVSQRTREVGIRMSLGASGIGVLGMVLRGAMQLVGIGGMLGLAAAIGLAQFLRHILYGVGTWDPVTIAGVPVLLACVAAAAALIPARRASRVSPVQALKYD